MFYICCYKIVKIMEKELEKRQIVIHCDASEETAHEIAIELLKEFGVKYEDETLLDGSGTITYWVNPK